MLIAIAYIYLSSSFTAVDCSGWLCLTTVPKHQHWLHLRNVLHVLHDMCGRDRARKGWENTKVSAQIKKQ